METKQAVLPLSAPVSTSILLCFGNRHNHITVFDETVFVSSMTLYLQAVRLSIQTPALRCKMLVGLCPNPFRSAPFRCRLGIFLRSVYGFDQSNSRSSKPVTVSNRRVRTSIILLMSSAGRASAPAIRSRVLTSDAVSRSVRQRKRNSSA